MTGRIVERDAQDLRAGMTAYLGGRYRELLLVTGARGNVVVVTTCTRGFVLEPDTVVRVRPTDRGAAG